MPSIYLQYPYDSGCPYHRHLLPARFCGEDFGKAYGWEFHVGDGLPPGHDIYMLQGLPQESMVIQVARLKAQGCKFVWSLDDDWLTIPEWNPAKPSDNALAMWYLLRDMADWIVVSTPHLATTLDSVKKKVLIAPNLLDLSVFDSREYTLTEDGRRAYNMSFSLPVRVVWTGGSTHKEDVAILEDCLDRLLSIYDITKVVVIFQGMMPPPKLTRKYLHRGLFHQPAVPFASYQKIINSIEPHIYLAPLAPVEFNLSKSNLRIMESWALMSCPIASDWGEYSCIKSGQDGRLVSGSNEWWNVLDKLIRDHEYRLGMSANGRQRVEEEYDWNNKKCRRPWYEAFSKILEVSVPEIT